jgi:hypothetical protein
MLIYLRINVQKQAPIIFRTICVLMQKNTVLYKRKIFGTQIFRTDVSLFCSHVLIVEFSYLNKLKKCDFFFYQQPKKEVLR